MQSAIAERYAAATTSSNLRCQADIGSDLDVVIAAGWAGRTQGALFSRCRIEFDAARASVAQGEVNAMRAEQDAALEDHRRPAPQLVALRSLNECRTTIVEWGIARNYRFGLELDYRVIRSLSWHALNVWLDPTCNACGGVGFTGGYNGAPKLRCHTCRETGKKRGIAGNSVSQRKFIEGLCARVDSAVLAFNRETSKALHRIVEPA